MDSDSDWENSEDKNLLTAIEYKDNVFHLGCFRTTRFWRQANTPRDTDVPFQL